MIVACILFHFIPFEKCHLVAIKHDLATIIFVFFKKKIQMLLFQMILIETQISNVPNVNISNICKCIKQTTCFI